jgi:outer membrane protein OmpA-like peptidoglycan-associated protein
MKKIISLFLAAMILVGGSDALAQNKKKSKKGKKDQASTFVEGRQKVRESDYATFDKFTTFSSKSTTLYYSPFDYFDFFELCADDNPDWGEDIKPVMNYMVKNTRATMTLCPLFAINPDITDRTQRQELIEKAKNEAQAAIDAFEGWKNRKGMRNKTQYKIAELDYRYFKGTNYYNQQRSDDIIRVGVLLYFGSKKNAIFVPDTASSHTFPDIKFFPNDATIVESWVPVLDELAEYINANDRKSVLLTGYADNQGTDAYIEGISRQRATEVKKALLLRGVDAARIELEVKGDADPIGDNSTYEGRIENNRVSIKIL